MSEIVYTDPNVTLVEETGTYVSIPDWVLLHPELSAGAVRLYGVLKRYARQSGRAWPGRSTLGGHLGCSEDTVDRYLKQLRDAGAVEAIPRWLEPIDGPHGHEGDRIVLEPGPGRAQTSNVYRVRWSLPPTPQEPPPPGRTTAATPRRKAAAPPAARTRHEVHALEVHAPEVQEEHARTTPPARMQANNAPTSSEEPEPSTPHALADRLLVRMGGNIAIGRTALVSLLKPAMENGVPVRRLEHAIFLLLHDGKALAPWTLQEYVAKVAAAGSSRAVAGW